MFHLVLQRILHKKWMVASLLIGNILLIAIAVSHPMYQDAARRRMLTDLFSNSVEKSNNYPMTIRTQGLIRKRAGMASAKKVREFADTITERFGLDTVADICFRRMTLKPAWTICACVPTRPSNPTNNGTVLRYWRIRHMYYSTTTTSTATTNSMLNGRTADMNVHR